MRKKIAHLVFIATVLAFILYPLVLKAQDTYILLTEWGSLGSGDGQFRYPFGLAVDASGNVYVADYYNQRIQKFDPDGNFLAKWGTYGSGDGQLKYPRMLTVDHVSGDVYVSDTENHRVQKFDSDGNFLTKWGMLGSGDGQFNQPFGVAVDDSGDVYVAEYRNDRVQKFDSDGNFLVKWGTLGSGDGQLYHPQGIAADSSGNVYVADLHNHRVQKFDPDGNFLTKWGVLGSGDGQFNLPQDVAVDASGNVYVADGGNNRVQKFDPDANFLTKWDTYSPYGIAVDGIGNVYVANINLHQIQKFSPMVVLTDPNLETAIRDALSKWSGPITCDDLAGLIWLDIPYDPMISPAMPISNLTGIEHCVNLQHLGLYDHSVANVAPLSNLSNLQELDLSANEISDISPLGGLIELSELSLIGNQISDLTPLTGLTNLQRLYLSGNQVSDISPLSGLNNLEALSLYSNQISDISPLVANTGLGEGDFVYLQNNPLNDEAYSTHIPMLQARGVNVLYSINHPPVADAQSVDTNEDTPIQITLTGSDPDGDALTFSLTSQPVSGSLSGIVPNLTYTPDHNFNGSDSFTFTVHDGKVESAPATVTITVDPVNDPPVISSLPHIMFRHGGSYSLNLDDYVSDPEDPRNMLTWTYSGNTRVEIDIDENRVATFSGTPTWTGTEIITLTATDPGGLSAHGSVQVSIRLYLQVIVIDENSGLPLSDAMVAVDGLEQVFTTSMDGKVNIIEPLSGTVRVYAFKSGYLPRDVDHDLDVLDVAIIQLPEGEIVTSNVTITEMTEEEMAEANISLEDPENYWAYKFTVTLTIADCPVDIDKPEVLPKNPSPGDILPLPPIDVVVPGDKPDDYVEYKIRPSIIVLQPPDPQDPVPQKAVVFIIIPGQVEVLKEFFKVTMLVQNLAPPVFHIDNSVATINVPPGLTLVELLGQDQPLSMSMGSIAGQSEAEAEWVVRGDVEGTHIVNVDFTGNLQPFNVNLSAPASGTVTVHGAPDLEFTFDTPSQVEAGVEFTFGLTLTNNSSFPARGTQAELFPEQFVNVQLAADETAQKWLGTIEPGQSKSTSWRLVPAISGYVIYETVEVDGVKKTYVQVKELVLKAIEEVIYGFAGQVVEIGAIVTDQNKNPIAGLSVRFEVVEGNGELSSTEEPWHDSDIVGKETENDGMVKLYLKLNASREMDAGKIKVKVSVDGEEDNITAYVTESIYFQRIKSAAPYRNISIRAIVRNWEERDVVLRWRILGHDDTGGSIAMDSYTDSLYILEKPVPLECPRGKWYREYTIHYKVEIPWQATMDQDIEYQLAVKDANSEEIPIAPQPAGTYYTIKRGDINGGKKVWAVMVAGDDKLSIPLFTDSSHSASAMEIALHLWVRCSHYQFRDIRSIRRIGYDGHEYCYDATFDTVASCICDLYQDNLYEYDDNTYADADDVVIFYYAGEGSEFSNYEHYRLVPDMDSPADAIADVDLDKLLDPINAEAVILILDACNSGGFAWKRQEDGKITAEGECAKEGRFILTSCMANENSLGSVPGPGSLLHPTPPRHFNATSVFTAALIDAMLFDRPKAYCLEDAYQNLKNSGYFPVLLPIPSVGYQNPDIYDEATGIGQRQPDGTVIITQAPTLERTDHLVLHGKVLSPVDLMINCPEGQLLSKTTNEVGDNAICYEADLDGDEDVDEEFAIFDATAGKYVIYVTPEDGAGPDDTYTLIVTYDGMTRILADELAVADIPPDGYRFTVTGEVNVPPVADDQSVSTDESGPVSITLTGSDPDGDELTYTVVDGPSDGSLSGTTPNLMYTPNPGFSGSDSFTFKVNDGKVDSNIATVNITVNPAGLQNVTNLVNISFARAPRTSRTTAAFDVTVTNDSGDALRAPVKLVIDKITSGVTVANPDGTGQADEQFAGDPYFTLLDTGELLPGASTEPKRIVFDNPSRVRFTFDVSCWAMTGGGSQAAPPKEQRLSISIPSESALAQNYPNPFNPDTWIPYELCEDSDVTISIYDISGRLIRKLELGHRNAGVYMSRDKAAYWDGRNEVGEKVASGVYFYSIKAGELVDTRKLLMIK